MSEAVLTSQPIANPSGRLFLTLAAATIVAGYGVSGAIAFWLSLAVRM